MRRRQALQGGSVAKAEFKGSEIYCDDQFRIEAT